MTQNAFTYINHADSRAVIDLLFWQEKIEDYINEFYGGNPDNTLRTKFGNCMSTSLDLLDYTRDNYNMFRGVKSNNILQAGAIIESRFGEIYLYDDRQQHVLLDILCSAPWNCLPQSINDTKKGAATWLIAEIIEEMTSPPNQMTGIFKVAAIPTAINFYKSVGFEENPDGSREMILTREKALQFLEEHRLRWR
jgi:hypothetical protein